ncbi:MAG: carotenoid oxygenase family protein [Sphingomonadales bacterium]|nr:carotenoid oxygenase family protein [Sphingomonadales bacterium]
MASAVETLIRGTITKGIMKVAEFNRDRAKAPVEPHPFLSGIHTPMDAELTLDELRVTGEIPAELDGRYIRIGPNPIAPNPAAYHWFLGDGMVHGVRLKGGKALWYRNRWIRSTKVSEALGEPPAPGTRSERFDTVNTNIVGHAGETWAIVEAGGFPVRIDAELNTIAHDPFGGTLHYAFSAHPHLDPDSGEMHAICYKGDVADTIWHVVVDASGKVIREEPVAVQHGPMIHDCMITKNYAIILDLPCTFSMKALIGGHPFPYRWNPEHKARVGLLPRNGSGGDVIWCDVEPCYVFHPCNGYEDADGTVILDVCAHDQMFRPDALGPDSTRVPFERWTIDPTARKVARTVIDDASQEFPRPNESLTGKPYRYAYAMALPDGFDASSPDQTLLFKHDLVAGGKQVHDFGAGRIPGEFVFVARSGATAEDDGWLIGYVIDTNVQTSELVILNAQDFEGSPVARVHIPHRIPPGFHGNWVVG